MNRFVADYKAIIAELNEQIAEGVLGQKEYKAQYEQDQPKLQAMSVKDVLTEMKQMQKLFG